MQFISRAACNGKPPRQLASQPYFNRNTLLATMMSDRQSIRYIVAPTGFGKSLLACSYADLVNGFGATTWLDCSNPCFLRDLDAHTLLPDLLSATACSALVVFDDVPLLGSVRRDDLAEVCRCLVEAQREVVVCATPAADPLRGREADCVCVTSRDLLYDDDDRELLRSLSLARCLDLPADTPASRVPALALGERDAYRAFIASHISDEDDNANAALTFALLALEQGSFEDAEALVGREVSFADIDVQRSRPFVEADEFRHEFSAQGFPFEEVLRSFMPRMALIAAEVGAEGASDFAYQVASVLLERGRADRAAMLLVELCDPHGRCQWLEENQMQMLDGCMVVEAERVFTSLRSEKWRSMPTLLSASCIRRAHLEAAPGERHAELVALAQKVDYPLDLRLEAASHAYVLTKDADVLAGLEAAISAQTPALKREARRLDGAHADLWRFWSGLGKAAADGTPDNTEGTPSRLSPLALAAALHRRRVLDPDEELPEELWEEAARVLEQRADTAEGRAAVVLLRREMDAVAARDASYSVPPCGKDPCAAFEDALSVQRASYARLQASRTNAIASALVAPARIVADPRVDGVPRLDVRLFGHFEVKIGGEVVTDSDFARRKLRMLLALLVLEAGHDLSCSNLGRRMWPDSSESCARHNLYNVVSILRRGLSLSDGSCPYLFRPHGIVRLEKKYLDSDVERLALACRRLRSEDPDPMTYSAILQEVDDVYRGDLLPTEHDEPMILSARAEWRGRLVNALMYAAKRLSALGDATTALQLLHKALASDPQREDCYEQLMSLQARCGQRAAAIDTWMRYRSYLTDELGLDPSMRVSSLYERILNDNA